MTLLVVPHCPHAEPAAALVRTALDDLGRLEVDVVTQVVDDAESLPRGFAGSPTFLVAGVDLFPTSSGSAGLSCRLYPGGGVSQGLPSFVDMRDSLKRLL